MTRLKTHFQNLSARHEKALICFLTAGDPDMDTTLQVVRALAAAGMDALELGIPFSDPLADGPAIQASSQRALEAGATVAKVLELTRQIRKHLPNLPIILMTYYNPLLKYGMNQYAADAAEAGVDAHIVTDLTPEEADQWKSLSVMHQMDTIFLLAPTSTPKRIQWVAAQCTGFVYCVSRTGVTGAREDIPAELYQTVQNIKSSTSLPVCVGFGVSQPEHVTTISAFADGVVVGSALVNLIQAHRHSSTLLQQVSDFTSALKQKTLPDA